MQEMIRSKKFSAEDGTAKEKKSRKSDPLKINKLKI
jgi:hypothetical protein